MENEEILAFINSYATTAFRDFADQDYISARIAYRNEFDQQFRWNALQAVEKYLKAILLYNGCSAKEIGHKVSRALQRVRDISELDFDIPKDVEEFIEYLNNYCDDRYLSYPTYLPKGALITLDKTIWHIRRYCFFMRGEFRSGGKNIVLLIEVNKRSIANSLYEKFPNKYRIFGGYLEKTLDKKLPAYNSLVWKNFYFGKKRKHKISIKDRFSMVNPEHFLFPECFKELNKFIDFPKEIVKQFSSSTSSKIATR